MDDSLSPQMYKKMRDATTALFDQTERRKSLCKTYMNLISYKCKYCPEEFESSVTMSSHIIENHQETLGKQLYTDSEHSNDSDQPLQMTTSQQKHRLLEEHNNNEISKRTSPNKHLDSSPINLQNKLKRSSSPDDNDLSTLPTTKKLLLNDESIIETKSNELLKSFNLTCPVCNSYEYENYQLLDEHMKKKHYDFKLNCDICNKTFKLYSVLLLHNYIDHTNNDDNNSLTGFQDLTFTDFTSNKFPSIARAVCEKSLHRPVNGENIQYQCQKCLRAFPCKDALDGHIIDCGNNDLNFKINNDDKQSRRNLFFQGLLLQDKNEVLDTREGKDLADISSILSLTSSAATFLPRSDASTPDHQLKLNNNNNTISNNNNNMINSSGSSGHASSEYQEEEVQDAFAAEFRKMKQRGEFPCRLCTAIFPNLRALKGHNRAHMNVAAGMPYPCNMCPYTSIDKGTLTRHLRSHNGAKPYECSICNFTFTTKANCERHIRNRHDILTRDGVKGALIYHPSEDTTNENIDNTTTTTSPRSVRVNSSTARKSLNYQNDNDDLYSSQSYDDKQQSVNVSLNEEQYSSSRFGDKSGMNNYEINDLTKSSITRAESINPLSDESNNYSGLNDVNNDVDDDAASSQSSDDSISLVSEAKFDVNHQRVKSPETRIANNGDDAPLDLSMDVLDLSKKSKNNNNNNNINCNNNGIDLSMRDSYERNLKAQQLWLTQALINAGQHNSQQQNSMQAICAASAQMFYGNIGGFPQPQQPGVAPTGLIPPFLYHQHLYNQDVTIRDRLQRELVRGLQLTSGGSIIEPSINNSNFPATSSSVPSSAISPSTSYGQSQNSSTLKQHETSGHQNLSPSSSALTNSLTRKSPSPSLSSRIGKSKSPNLLKMVIKNGVLMPKQKQRRYRTERPHNCPHCHARFTLRSNMERHIKQQHPQHWRQRPRGGHSTRGRPPINPPTLLKNYNHSGPLSSPPSPPPPPPPPASSSYNVKQGQTNTIPDQVKYAILAKKLKADRLHGNDSGDESLVIDEKNTEKNHEKSANEFDYSSSLLRSKLIESSSQNNKKFLETPPEKSKVEEDVVNCVNNNVKSETESVESEKKIEEQQSRELSEKIKSEDGNVDLASVSKLLDNASHQYQQFQPQYISEEEEGLIASTSEHDFNNSGSDEKSDSINSGNSSSSQPAKKKKKLKKKSAYSMAPNRVICPYCAREFPWSSSLRRHILTHTGQKPYQCDYCSLFFTTKSNCDRHLTRKHKFNRENARQARNSSSPDLSNHQDLQSNNNNNNNNNFSMRNVPERPYKCNQCPSSTFSTLGNLKKHISTKHSSISDVKSSPGSPVSDGNCDQQSSPIDNTSNKRKQNDQSGYESQCSSNSDNLDNHLDNPSSLTMETNGCKKLKLSPSSSPRASPRPSPAASPVASPRASPGPSDAPFKCHLCDSGFSVRHDCLIHIKLNHHKSYETLMAKGALNMNRKDSVDQQPPVPPSQTSDGEEKRGKFPDYRNRKVVCAFCMRRFWSAEDLRRHMRTHTGERPFLCDICHRRFTLKHSMLRHRKKHTFDTSTYIGTSGDEDNATASTSGSLPQQAIIAQSEQQAVHMSDTRSHERMSLPNVGSIATGDAAPSGIMPFHSYDHLSSLTSARSIFQRSSTQSAAENAGDNENDLISNLLGIQDKSIIDKVLKGSPDDAAKLLGVPENHE